MDPTVLEVSDKELMALAQKIERERNFDCSQFRPSYLRRRVMTRLRASGARDVFRYMHLLDVDEEEWARLIAALTVNVTGFFRDPSMWECLRTKVVPRLFEQKRARRQSYVRVWSAGCATGQEAYSLAMLFSDLAEERGEQARVRITATDYDAECLAKARAGLYAPGELGGLTGAQRVRHMRPVPGGMEVKPHVRAMVRFLQLDLFGATGQKMMDMVLCRNVLMYFTPPQQVQVLRKFKESLNSGGYLVLGKSEKLAAVFQCDFEYVSLAERVYRKK